MQHLVPGAQDRREAQAHFFFLRREFGERGADALDLFFLGGDGDIEEVNQIITNEKLEDIVKYEGWVSGEKKVELLNMADAYILPSYNEGLPISVLEAMSYKLPIISTKVGGIPEILEDGINGFIMEPGDKKAIKEAIDRLMNDVDLRKKMGLESAHKVKAHLPEHVEKQLEQLYDHLLA